MIQSSVPYERTYEEEKLKTQVIYVILKITFFMKFIRNSKFN